MYPLHPGHPGQESVFIVALAVIVLVGGFALTRKGWSRVGALVGVATLAAVLRISLEIVTVHVHEIGHLVGHGLELGLVVCTALAGYYAFDTLTIASSARE